MSDTIATPDAPPAPGPAPVPAQETQQPKTATKPAQPVSVPGGIPGVPALTIGTGSVVTAVSSASLAAGPGVAAMVAGGLVAATAAAAAVRGRPARQARRDATKRAATAKQSAAAKGAAGGATNRTSSPTGRVPAPARPGAGKTAAAHRSAGLGSTAPGRHTAAKTAGQRAATGSTAASTGRKGATATGASATKAGLGRIGQIRAARAAAKANTPATRGEQRRQLTADRRTVADARRQAKRDAKALKAGKTTAAPAGSTAARQPGRMGAWADRKRAALRQAADTRRDRRVAQERKAITARLRARGRRAALRKVATRYQRRRLRAAVLAAPAGLLALLLHLPARLLGMTQPRWGRAVYERLADIARQERVGHVDAVEAAHRKAEQDADTDTETNTRPALAKKVNRVADSRATDTTEGATPVGIFDFREHAEDMLSSAQNAEHGGMMGVLAAFDNLPETMSYLAQTFAVVAQRCAEEMPLDAAVAEAVEDIYKQLCSAAEAAENVSKIFREAHPVEIARFEDPRPGERSWDIGEQE